MSESGKRNSSSSESETMMIRKSSQVFVGGLRDEEAMGPGKSSSEEESNNNARVENRWRRGGICQSEMLGGGAQINWTPSCCPFTEIPAIDGASTLFDNIIGSSQAAGSYLNPGVLVHCRSEMGLGWSLGLWEMRGSGALLFLLNGALDGCLCPSRFTNVN